jgi:hypothetical protein
MDKKKQAEEVHLRVSDPVQTELSSQSDGTGGEPGVLEISTEHIQSGLALHAADKPDVQAALRRGLLIWTMMVVACGGFAMVAVELVLAFGFCGRAPFASLLLMEAALTIALLMECLKSGGIAASLLSHFNEFLFAFGPAIVALIHCRRDQSSAPKSKKFWTIALSAGLLQLAPIAIPLYALLRTQHLSKATVVLTIMCFPFAALYIGKLPTMFGAVQHLHSLCPVWLGWIVLALMTLSCIRDGFTAVKAKP